jgi:putative hydrolase of HD superfamily
MNGKFKHKINFLKEIEVFKTIKRTCKKSSSEHESDAEHSWHLAMAVLTFENEIPKIYSLNKLMKLALTHDLLEIKTGDFNPFTDDLQKKDELEKKALKELKNELKENQHIYLLIEEYELQETNEAKLIKKLDKLMPLIQNITTKEKKNYSAYIETEITEEQAEKYQSKFFQKEDFTKELYIELFQEAIKKNIFYLKQ